MASEVRWTGPALIAAAVKDGQIHRHGGFAILYMLSEGLRIYPIFRRINKGRFYNLNRE